MMTRLIVHICTQEAWRKALQTGVYRADSLHTEGFIHCSKPDQVLQVANNYYPGQENLLLLWINPDDLVAELRWERVTSDSFPHLYGPLNLEAVQAALNFPPDEQGMFPRIPYPSQQKLSVEQENNT